MKHLLISVALTAAATCAVAQPAMVGHRGSRYGLENSLTSFTSGADMGYDLLECDVRVSADSVLVLSHDETTERLGGKLKVAEATLAELKAETLHQRRAGVDYTDKICTLDEYLALCVERGVRPLIELKWGTGINSKDCSNMHLLVEAIERHGVRDKCIVLTSMKPCLEHLRTHYPDIELQFLTGKYWANHFDWCVKWGIDVDIQVTYFDAETVKKFHDKGLKVNMWTTNTPEGYREFTDMGCDFITTDIISPRAMPGRK